MEEKDDRWFLLKLSGEDRVAVNGQQWYEAVAAKTMPSGEQFCAGGKLVKESILPKDAPDVEVILVHLVDHGQQISKEGYKVSAKQVPIRCDILSYLCGDEIIPDLRSRPFLAATAFLFLSDAKSRDSAMQMLRDAFGG